MAYNSYTRSQGKPAFEAPNVANLLAQVQDTVAQNTTKPLVSGWESYLRSQPRLVHEGPSSVPGASGGGGGAWDGSQEGYARDLLRRIGAPDSQTNVEAMTHWMQYEGGHYKNNATYNPLNTTWNAPGASSINGVGVRAYPDYETGIGATVKTLSQGYYTHIVDLLRRGNASPREIYDAIVSSPWGTKNL